MYGMYELNTFCGFAPGTFDSDDVHAENDTVNGTVNMADDAVSNEEEFIATALCSRRLVNVFSAITEANRPSIDVTSAADAALLLVVQLNRWLTVKLTIIDGGELAAKRRDDDGDDDDIAAATEEMTTFDGRKVRCEEEEDDDVRIAAAVDCSTMYAWGSLRN
jgi:hypothetical protein